MEVVNLLSPTDAWDLITAIKHIDHRSATPDDAMLFAQIINDVCNPTLTECLAAVAKWFGTHHDFGLIQPGDVADLVKANRPSAKLTQNQIDTALTAQGLEGDALWIAGRQIRGLVNRGMSFEQAVSHAAQESRGKQLTAAPSKPRAQVGHHFIGNLKNTSINQIL